MKSAVHNIKVIFPTELHACKQTYIYIYMFVFVHNGGVMTSLLVSALYFQDKCSPEAFCIVCVVASRSNTWDSLGVLASNL